MSVDFLATTSIRCGSNIIAGGRMDVLDSDDMGLQLIILV